MVRLNEQTWKRISAINNITHQPLKAHVCVCFAPQWFVLALVTYPAPGQAALVSQTCQDWLTPETSACFTQPEQIRLHGPSLRAHTVCLQELLRRSCQRRCCRESLSLAGSSFSCLFMSNSWELEKPLDRPGWIYQTGSDCSAAAFLSKAAVHRRMNT